MSSLSLPAPVQGTVVAIEVEPGQAVAAGQVLALVEAMKMEVPLEAPTAGTVLAVQVGLRRLVAWWQANRGRMAT